LGGAAEFRGPGIRNQFEENPEDYELDNDRARPFSVRSNRIILLGDGSALIPGKQNDEELFDQTDEDQDLSNQVQRQDSDAERKEREGTPGPTSQTDASASNGPESSTSPGTPQKPASS
jgi:protein phosphatase 2C family protein 2/3